MNKPNKKIIRASTAFKSIGIGRENAYTPPKSIEKEFSDLVDIQNSKGDVIINLGNGYYRPNPLSNPGDEEFNAYIAQEYERANAIIDKCNAMRNTYNSIIKQIMKSWEDNTNEETS